MFGQDSRVEALAGARPIQLDGGAADLQSSLGRVAVGPVLGMVFQMEVPFSFERRVEHVGEARLQQLWQIRWRKLALQLRTLRQLSEKLIKVRLHRRRRLVIFHMT